MNFETLPLEAFFEHRKQQKRREGILGEFLSPAQWGYR